MSACESTADFCLCGQAHPCQVHGLEAIEAAYRALGPAPKGCQCGRCVYAQAHPILKARPREDVAPPPMSWRREMAANGSVLAGPVLPAPSGPTLPDLPPVAHCTAPAHSLPVAPFVAAAGYSVENLPPAELRMLRRAKIRGWVTEDQADTWSVALGLAAEQIWPELLVVS